MTFVSVIKKRAFTETLTYRKLSEKMYKTVLPDCKCIALLVQLKVEKKTTSNSLIWKQNSHGYNFLGLQLQL